MGSSLDGRSEPSTVDEGCPRLTAATLASLSSLLMEAFAGPAGNLRAERPGPLRKPGTSVRRIGPTQGGKPRPAAGGQ